MTTFLSVNKEYLDYWKDRSFGTMFVTNFPLIFLLFKLARIDYL